MAKKPKKRDLVREAELAMRESLGTVFGLSLRSEEEYCAVVLAALDLIRTGMEMRLDELKPRGKFTGAVVDSVGRKKRV